MSGHIEGGSLDSVAQGKSQKDENEIDYNPTSLAGQISVKEMGTRAKSEPEGQKSQPPTTEQTNQSTNTDSFSEDYALENMAYRPTTAQNSDIFEQLIVCVRKHIPDESHSVILSAADAILEVLKGDTGMTQQKAEIEKLLSLTLDEEQFTELSGYASQITDFGEREEEEESGDIVAVEFEEDGAQDQFADTGMADDIIPDNLEAAEDTKAESVPEGEDMPHAIVVAPGQEKEGEEENGGKEAEGSALNLGDITPDFLFSRLSAAAPETDADEIRETCKKISRVLNDSEIAGENLEQRLMAATDFRYLDFVHMCMEQRWRIVFGVKLKQNRAKALEQMRAMGLEELEREASGAKKRAATEVAGERKRARTEETRDIEETSTEDVINTKDIPEDTSDTSENTTTDKSTELRVVDLGALAFDQGAHLMASAKISLPKGSYQQNKKQYDIISVPAPTPTPPPPAAEPLVSVAEMPEWAQAAFPAGETATLNRIQSQIYPKAFLSDENLLLCAPTGAGKTNVAMLALLRVLGNNRDASGRVMVKKFKCVYIAPLKALVAEQTREFSRRLTSFGVVVKELTGDSALSAREIREAQVLVTTPEKWDVVTRKEPHFARLVQLVVLDEIHLLHDERGPVLESIVVRAKRAAHARLVGLSATLPNYEDVASFLGVRAAGLFYFDASFRPCPLQQEYIGIKEKKAIRKVAAMNDACFEKVASSVAQGHQVIVFVHSRKDTVRTAQFLAARAEAEGVRTVRSDGAREILAQEAAAAKNKNLAEILPSGFAVHHAGLARPDRSAVEDLFAQGHVQVLVSTATLAWGVNLPAHTVIIKGTDTYSPEKGSWVQLSPQDILQMLGRAGRPRYDKSGEGVIITAHDELQYYLAVLNQQLPIESQLMARLADCINAEVASGAVDCRAAACDWLAQTYLYIRMLRSPRLYQVGAEYAGDTALERKRADLAHSALVLLAQHRLVDYDPQTGKTAATELGRIAANFYISYTTAAAYHSALRPWMSEIDLLGVFARADEFRFVPVRAEEKVEVARLADQVPIPLKEAPDRPRAKIGVLLQAHVSRLRLDGFALLADMVYVTQSGGRLLRALFEMCRSRRWAQLAHAALSLCKSVESRMWQAASPFRQFGDLAPDQVVRAAEASHLPFSSYFDLSPAELAEAINFRGHSAQAHQLLAQYPRFELEARAHPVSADLVRVSVRLAPNWTWNAKVHARTERFWLTVEDGDGERILHDEEVRVSQDTVGRDLFVDCVVAVSEPLAPALFVCVASESWLHSQWRAPVQFFDVRMPKAPSAPTKLADATVPLSALDLEVKDLGIPHLNRMQTQCLHSVFRTNENVFVGAPKGTGKTVLAQLALLACWRQNKQRAVYIQPTQALVDARAREWAALFAPLTDPPKNVARLTGDAAADARILALNHLVLATPEQFDAVSRRWRSRRALQDLGVVIADDVHLLGARPAYEAVLARLRLMAGQGVNVRVVALGSPVLYGREMASWLGCAKEHTYNFVDAPDGAREVRLEPLGARADAAACAKFVAASRQCVAFAPTHVAAAELVAAIVEVVEENGKSDKNGKNGENGKNDKNDTNDKNDKNGSNDQASPDLSAGNIADGAARRALGRGVGLLHENLVPADRAHIVRLFSKGQLRVLVATRPTAAYAPPSRDVAVFGTSASELTHSGAYFLSDVAEMVGCARGGRALIFAPAPQLAYYARFVAAPLPVESALDGSLAAPFAYEVAVRTFRSKQDAVDWLTYTWLYRRLAQNPSFYGLKDVSHLGVSEFLSELVESTLESLAEGGLLEVNEDDDEDEDRSDDEDDEELSPLNGAMIASHYNVSPQAVAAFAALSAKDRLRGIFSAVVSAPEFESLPVRADELPILTRLSSAVPLKLAPESDLGSPHTKAFLLLQAYLSRISVSGDLASDQRTVLEKSLPLVFACTDTLSSEGHLNALQAMDLAQMLVQGMWNSESPLRQLPHVTQETLARAKKYNVESVYDIMALEDKERDDVLQLQEEKLNDVACFVNKYPNIDISYEMDVAEPLTAGEQKQITITVERDEEMEDLLVESATFPFPKQEGWWLVVGDATSRQLYAIKKISVAHETQSVTMSFSVPTPGKHKLTVWCMCDSYIDADKEMEVEVEVV
ncbi:hypothetical protein CLUG_02989 [Clavispora lusitaniae ATCC 42720]|uniref:U5 small nuclear ribonucleoprotein 200 kDa helicase n=2 Tax=Clavispora lusitaniae TaxID=36911 RepID=C4Y376_CLAL4|nr:uncharacterized protein CLUG_02989 [Clavispora lusitaniae ATCC 42720]EEQ38863.1 hypothetical protein CLUG_02989 [Clavispora lusitaniae ATCC 42720]